MRLRILAIAVVAVSTLVACGSGGGSSSSSAPATSAGVAASVAASPAPAATSAPSGATNVAALCANLQKVGQKISDITAAITDPSKLKELIDANAAFLATLKQEAPAALAPAIDNLTSLLRQAESALSNPSKPDLSKLAGLATQVPADTQQIADYVKAHCGAAPAGSAAAS